MQIRSYSRTSSYDNHWYLSIHKFYHWLIMWNPIKNWVFDLIEDAIGSKAMKQFKKEEVDKKNSKTNIKLKQD